MLISQILNISNIEDNTAIKEIIQQTERELLIKK